MPAEEPRRRGCKGPAFTLASFSMLILLRSKFALPNNRHLFVNLQKRKRLSTVVGRSKPESSCLTEIVRIAGSDLHSSIVRRLPMR